MRMNKCARSTCKFCPCYKRHLDMEEENLLASDQFQNLLDEISSASESESFGSLSSYSSDSDFE